MAPLHPNDVSNEFNGTCPFHRGCLEGLAAGPSLEARTGIRGELIEQNSEVWDVQAYYIAQAAVQATVLTVQKLSSLVAVLWGKNTCFVVSVKNSQLFEWLPSSARRD